MSDSLPDPERVASRGAPISARDLIRLIHRVNPTGDEAVDPAEAERRYRLKARLQSRLILEFGAALVVETTDREGIVSLRHRHFAEDAGHARVENLDGAARAWVRRALGERGPTRPPSPRPRGGTDRRVDARPASPRPPRGPGHGGGTSGPPAPPARTGAARRDWLRSRILAFCRGQTRTMAEILDDAWEAALFQPEGEAGFEEHVKGAVWELVSFGFLQAEESAGTRRFRA